MNLIIYATLTTSLRSGGTRGPIELFKMTLTVKVTTLLIASRDVTQVIKTDKGTFKIPILTATSSDTLIGHSTGCLNHQEASSPEYVRNLLKQGWQPIRANWIAAASEGYRFPEGVT